MYKRISLLTLIVLLVSAFAIPVTHAQEDEMGIVCDSTLATLLLVAEHDYGYLSGMMMDEEMMNAFPNLEAGQFGPLFESVVMMSMDSDMMDEEMSEDEMEMEAHDMMLDEMMGMDSTAMINAYLESMGMTSESMTTLAPGNVTGEDPACAAARQKVEDFLLAHLLTEMSMAGEME